MTHTPLKLSKRLKDLGILQHSAFYWQEYEDHKPMFVYGSHEFFNGIETSAFTLGEIPSVLRQLYIKLGWDNQIRYKGKNWDHYWMQLCAIYATVGEEKAWSYLSELIQ